MAFQLPEFIDFVRSRIAFGRAVPGAVGTENEQEEPSQAQPLPLNEELGREFASPFLIVRCLSVKGRQDERNKENTLKWTERKFVAHAAAQDPTRRNAAPPVERR